MIIDEKLCKYTRKQLGRYKSGISITFTTNYLFYFSLFRPLTKRSGWASIYITRRGFQIFDNISSSRILFVPSGLWKFILLLLFNFLRTWILNARVNLLISLYIFINLSSCWFHRITVLSHLEMASSKWSLLVCKWMHSSSQVET